MNPTNSSDSDIIHPAEGVPPEAVLHLSLLTETFFYFGNLCIIMRCDVGNIYFANANNKN